MSLAATCDRPAEVRGQQELAFFIGYGYNGCLAVETSANVGTGAELLALVAGQAPTRVTLGTLHPWAQALSRPRRRAGDCTSAFWEPLLGKASEAAIRLASVADVPHLPEDEVFFAVRPSTAEVVGGEPVRLGDRDARRLASGVASALPSAWPLRRVLVHAYRYVSDAGGGHEVVELYAGLPVPNARGVEPPIKSIAIRRLFLVDHQLAGHEDYSRESGVEERVDTEAPQLTYDNWSWSGTEQTVAFVKLDDTGAWSRLSTNIGFEGINWYVQELRAGMPRTFSRYLYTSH